MEKGGRLSEVAGWKFESVELVVLTTSAVSLVSVRFADVS